MIFDMCPLGTVAMNVLVVTMPKVISLSTEEAKQCSRVRKRQNTTAYLHHIVYSQK
jgi:hypothetical protein